MRPDIYFTTPEFKLVSLQVMIDEANRVAQELNLPEQLPITKSNLSEAMIDPPAFAHSGSLGRVCTSNYAYFFTIKKKFAGLFHLHTGKVYDDIQLNLSKMDTNAAFLEACRILRAVSMDVGSLNRDCVCQTEAGMFHETKGKGIVYTVNWRKGRQLIAFVHFVQPGRIILQLQMFDAQYIHRKPLEIPNFEKLLRDGDAPKSLLQRMGFDSTNDPPKQILIPQGARQ